MFVDAAIKIKPTTRGLGAEDEEEEDVWWCCCSCSCIPATNGGGCRISVIVCIDVIIKNTKIAALLLLL